LRSREIGGQSPPPSQKHTPGATRITRPTVPGMVLLTLRCAALRGFLCRAGPSAPLHIYVRHLPVTGRFVLLLCLRPGSGITTRAEPRVAARRPPAFPRAARPATWRSVAGPPVGKDAGACCRRRSTVAKDPAVVTPLATPPVAIKAGSSLTLLSPKWLLQRRLECCVFRSLIPSLNSPESLYKRRATPTRQRRQVEPTWHGQKQQHAGRRYKKHILPPGTNPTAPVLLYLRSAPATALPGLSSVPLLIAGASQCH
jgi:hypothetical protein